MKKVQFTAENDYDNAPFSGWTRDHYEDLFIQMMASIMNSASPGGARQRIPGPRSHHGQLADELEGFTRSMYMGGPWLSQSESGIFEYEGKTYDVGRYYRTAVIHGTNPENPEYWGDIVDFAQHLVEMAALTWGLFVSRKHTWDKMTLEEQDQVAAYLFQCTKVKYHQNNWLLFNVITNAVLKAFGKPYSQDQIDANLSACDSMYLGDGWYRDGDINRIDYYNAWAFHYYYLMWTVIDGESKPDLAEIHKERCKEFVRDFRYFFAADGATPCFGRSMTYRFSYLAPVAMGVLLDCLDIDPGESRTMISLGLKFFFDQEILTKDGHLSLGYIHPNASILEHYSCGGSPYWAAKALSIFLLPKEHEFWSVKEKALPIHKGDFSKPLPTAGLLMKGSKDSGHVQLINHKSYHDKDEYNAKYTNFAYSSVFTYESRAVYGSWNMDNALLFSEDGVNYSQRWDMKHKATIEDFSYSVSSIHNIDEEGRVFTYTVMKDETYINIHVIETLKEGIDIKEGGYPLGINGNIFETEVTGTSTWVSGDNKLSFVKNLHGWDTILEATAFAEQLHGTNARYEYSRTPGVAAELKKGTSLFITQVSPSVGNTATSDFESLVTIFSIVKEGSGFNIELEFFDGDKVQLFAGDVGRENIYTRSGLNRTITL